MNNLKRILFGTVILATIVWSMGMAALVPMASAATLSSGDLIKASGPAVYYYAEDGKRYTFPTLSTYMTWYSDFDDVKTITDDELAAIDLAGNVVVRPGTNLVKIDTVPKVFAVEANGSLKHVADEASAEALYGADWAKKIVIIPDGFWTNYTDSGVALDGTTYPEGQLVKTADSSDIYYVNADGSWSMFADEASMTANNFRMADVITTSLIMGSAGTAIAAADATLIDVSQGGGATIPSGAGDLTVSNSGTPASNYVSKGAQNALFAKFTLTASSGDVEVDEIVLTRKGLGYDADISTVRLYEGSTQLGTDQSMNTNDHTVTFKNLNWDVESGETKTLSVKVNVATSPSGTNDYFELTSIDADGDVSGLPVSGNAMSFSALSVGQLDVDSLSSGSSVTVISGDSDLELGCWNFTASSTEGFNIDSVKFTNIGSAAATEVENMLLKQGPTVISDTVTSLESDGTVVFELDPYYLKSSTVKKVCLYGDIASGITVSKTVRFQVAEAKHVVARGESSGGEVLSTYSSGTSFTSQSAKTNTISQGSATLAQNSAYAPATGGTFVKGVEANKMAAYKLTAGANEGVKLTKLTVVLAGTNVANTDFSNWSLYKIVDGVEVEVPVTGSVSGLNVTFEDTTDGLLEVAKSENETLIVKADVSTSAAGNESGAHIYVGSNGTTNTVARIKGLESGDYITSGVTLSGVATGNAQTFSVGANGSLTVSKALTSPSADTVAKGTSAYHFTNVNLYATGEDIEVTDLDLTAYETAGTSNAVDSGELTNVYVTDADGNQLGSTCSAPSSGVCSFSFSYTIPKDENKTLKVYGDVPGSSTASYIHIDMDTADTDITSAGVYSSATITETGTATGSTMTVGSPTLVAAMANSPIASSYVVGDAGKTIGKLLLTAGTTEDVKVTSIKVSADDASGITGASYASLDITNIHLIDADTGAQYGVTQNFTDGSTEEDYVIFSGIDNLTVTKGETAIINVIVDVFQDSDSATPTYYFGVLDASSDVTGVGVLSNTSATVTPSSFVESAGATLASVGNLYIAKSADMPASTQLVSGSTDNVLAKYKLTGSYEDFDVTALTLELSADISANISNVKLYADGVQIGATNGYVFSSADKAINLTSGTLIVPKDENVILTIKGDLNAKSQVTTSATSRYIGIKDASGTYGTTGTYTVTAKGVSSGTADSSIADSSGNIYRSNAMTIHKGILTVSLNTSSPSGTAVAGAGSELLRLDLKATGDDITVNDIEFVKGGTCTVAGSGTTTLKSSDETTTYESWAAAAGLDLSDWNVSVDGGDAWTTALEVSAGKTKTVKLFGDTTGCTTNETLQVSLTAPTSSNGTTAGIEYADSSTTNIDLSTTKNLPVNGGSFTY